MILFDEYVAARLTDGESPLVPPREVGQRRFVGVQGPQLTALEAEGRSSRALGGEGDGAGAADGEGARVRLGVIALGRLVGVQGASGQRGLP